MTAYRFFPLMALPVVLLVLTDGCCPAVGGLSVRPVTQNQYPFTEAVSQQPDEPSVKGGWCDGGEPNCTNSEDCRRRCKEEDALSCFWYAKVHAKERVERETVRDRALHLGMKSCEEGRAEGCLAASAVLFKRALKPGYDCAMAAISLRLEHRACDLGCADACFSLSGGYLCRSNDIRIPKLDKELGMRLLQRSRKLGHELALEYPSGFDKPKEECLECYKVGCGCSQEPHLSREPMLSPPTRLDSH